MNKRIKSLLLCLVMAFTLVATAAPALADSVEPTTLGDSAEAASVTDGTPTDEGTPANDGTPTDEGTPANDGTPTDEGTPAGDGTPTGEGTPVTDSDTTTITPSLPGSANTNIPSYSIPFTKIVKLGEDGEVEPGEQEFELEIIPSNSGHTNYETSTLFTTEGDGSFERTFTISGTSATDLVTSGFYVREESLDDLCWDCDATVYFVVLDDQNTTTFKYFKATSDGNGGYTTTNNSESAESLTFTNTYTERNKTVEIPFTKTVKLGGDVAPGAQDFELEILKFVDENGEANYPGVSYTATVSTNGAGDYEGKLVITGPEIEVCERLAAEGFCVREKNTGADKWTYDDVVWFVKCEDGANEPSFYPATLTENGYGYDYEAAAAAKMTFENTYTENKPVPTATPKPTSPKTGDESAPLLWLVLVLVLGGTAAAGIVIASRKKTER